MKKSELKELSKDDIKNMIYDFIDDNLMPESLEKFLKKEGVLFNKCNIRREERVLKIIVDGYKFSINLIAEREK